MAHQTDPMRPLTANVTQGAADTTTDRVWWEYLWFLTFAFWPRLIIAGFVIFGSTIGDAFGGWVVPVLGFLVAPNTVLAYAFMWGASSDKVSGAEWLVVAVGALLDLSAWAALRRALHAR